MFRLPARMYAAPIPLATWIIVAIAGPVGPGKATVILTVNVRVV